MSDLTDRLRELGVMCDYPVCIEAIAKIDRLTAERDALREVLQAVSRAMRQAWDSGQLTSPPWTPEMAAKISAALKREG